MLDLDGICIDFGGLRALDRVTLSVGAGEIVGLVGPNGAGKTTLFNVISGTVRPHSGALRFAGVDIVATPSYVRARRGVGRTFQIPQPLQSLTVAENLLVAQRFGAGRVDRAALAEILERVGLEEKAARNAATDLSLTELKALEVAKALATSPKLLLLDEVLAGIEAVGKRAFTRLLLDLHQRYRLTMLIIEHDIEAITALCPRVVVLDYGKLIADGSPSAVFSDPAVIESYVGMPIHA
jgi:branched-chain amino acid transport system ATP-binding protein